MDGDGLPESRPTKPGWKAGTCEWMDWGKQIDRRLLETAWYAWALAGLESISRAGGLPSDPIVIERRHSSAAAFDRVFWDDAVHAYRSKGFGDAPDDRGNAIAVCAGLPPEQRHADLVRLCSQREASSIYMEHYVVDALFLLGRPDLALARLKRRYADCMASPCSTLPEDFGRTGLETNHAWGAAAATTIVQRLAGVRPTGPGYSSFIVEPCPADITQFELRFPSIRGNIAVNWSCSDTKVILKMTCPPKSSAIVVVPSIRKWTAITCNGVPAWPKAAPSCSAVRIDDSPRFEVHAGEWSFEAR